ncbi:MAG: hypothetical protein FJ035_10475 [Chloroflexi bacterium]|nr:hypothetical protein [Chloroflexota bacterium]
MRVAGGQRASRRWCIAALFAVLALATAYGGDDATNGAPSTGATPASAGATSSATAFPLTLRGSGGVDVRLKRRLQHVVSLSAGHTEGLFAIGAAARLVARDRFAD